MYLLIIHIGPTLSNGHKRIDNIFFLHIQELVADSSAHHSSEMVSLQELHGVYWDKYFTFLAAFR
jgi:hypothetical protein